MPSSWLAPVSAYLASEPPFHAEQELRLTVGGIYGWISPEVAATLARWLPRDVQVAGKQAQLHLQGADYAARSQELQALAERLRDAGLVSGWRAETMVLRDADDRPWAALERAAFRTLGLTTTSVHLNAMVQTADGTRMWIATRSADKAVDPGRLDNLVGGGVTQLEGITETLQREAGEEAGLLLHRPPACRARLHVLRRTSHGVQDELVHVHDCWLPAAFQPRNHDGEVAATACLPLGEVLSLLCRGEFTRDAALVILDGLCRQYFFGAETAALRALLMEQGVYR